jgi:hypothetical protein
MDITIGMDSVIEYSVQNIVDIVVDIDSLYITIKGQKCKKPANLCISHFDKLYCSVDTIDSSHFCTVVY